MACVTSSARWGEGACSALMDLPDLQDLPVPKGHPALTLPFRDPPVPKGHAALTPPFRDPPVPKAHSAPTPPLRDPPFLKGHAALIPPLRDPPGLPDPPDRKGLVQIGQRLLTSRHGWLRHKVVYP